MSKKKPYLFDTHKFDSDVFDEDAFLNTDDDVDVDVEPEAPTFSEDQLETAKSESFKRGKMEGYRESEEGISRETHSLLERVSDNLRDLIDKEGARRETFEREAMQTVKAIFKQAFPLTMKSKGLDEIFALVEDVLSEHLGQSKIVISVQDRHAEALENFILSKFKATPETVEIKVDDTVALGECAISWENGGAVRNLSRFEEKIEAVFAQALAQESDKEQNKDTDSDATSKNGDSDG